MLGKASAANRCICNHCDQAPPGLATAHENASTWFAMLLAKGTRLSGSMSALALTNFGAFDSAPVAWPLMRSMIVDPGDTRITTGQLARFDDPMETAALRAMQASDDASQSDPRSSEVVKAGATTYALYTRDELPDDVAQGDRCVDEALGDTVMLPAAVWDS